MKQHLITFALLCGLSGSAPAADSPPCADPVRHQFDFWIGDWQVTAGGKQVGTNRIDSLADGCALLENWIGAGGNHGHSLNFYDSTRMAWMQAWADSTATTLVLEGHFENGHMQLSSLKPGIKVADRITWTPNKDGTVRQFWDHTDDGGKTWSVSFDGLYRRMGK